MDIKPGSQVCDSVSVLDLCKYVEPTIIHFLKMSLALTCPGHTRSLKCFVQSLIDKELGGP